MQLINYFTDQKIIQFLCKERIKLANRRNDHQYVDRFAGGQTTDHSSGGISCLLPPRRQWAAFRPAHRDRVADVNLASLQHATRSLLQSQPSAAWAANLRIFTESVRNRVFGLTQFAFASPRISWQRKDGSKYRALCRFDLQDNLINSLFAKYLRDFFDPAFEPTSYAFRSRNADGIMPTHHLAFETIHGLKHEAPDQDLWVAECDIRGFYDTVDHEVALRSFDQAVARMRVVRSGWVIDPRALHILSAYLSCYSFPHSVLAETGPRLTRYDPAGSFPWPEDALTQFHPNLRAARIGVPQGGAMSCVIANLVLDVADKKVAAVNSKSHHKLHYFRYCDDMILLSQNKSDCTTGFEAYLAALNELKLPFHPPVTVTYYDQRHWQNKSKSPYRWSGRKWFGCVPWIQFVGYQVRYDGLVRIKPGSVDKQIRMLMETTSKLKSGLMGRDQLVQQAETEPVVVRASKQQVMSSLTHKLVAKGVGRVNPKKLPNGPLPMCWAGGFKALHLKPFTPTFLTRLDRQRERQVRRMNRASITYGPGTRSRHSGRGRSPSPVGYRFSYFAQFHNAGGRALVDNPFRPHWWERLVMAPIYSLIFRHHNMRYK